jgi:hypothetical protein
VNFGSQHMGSHSPREAPMYVRCREQYAPLRWFLGMSVKANDCLPPINTHIQSTSISTSLCQHTHTHTHTHTLFCCTPSALPHHMLHMPQTDLTTAGANVILSAGQPCRCALASMRTCVFIKLAALTCRRKCVGSAVVTSYCCRDQSNVWKPMSHVGLLHGVFMAPA